MIDLNFSQARRVETENGPRYLQTAVPTRDFWKAWRFDRAALCAAGVFIRSREDGSPMVHRLHMYDPDEKISPAPVPEYVLRNKKGLKPFQPAAVSALCSSLLSNRIALDASDAGIGKTYHALAVCRELHLRPAVICTKTGIPAWKNVCCQFGLSPLFIINWEAVITRKLKRAGVYKLVSSFPYCRGFISKYTGRLYYAWNIPENTRLCLIFDESHKGNGRDTSQAKILLAAKKYNVLCLSATLADKPESLRTIGAMCGLFNYENFTAWLQARGCYQDSYHNWKSVCPSQDMARISRRLFPRFGCRLRKKDIPGFPQIQNIACMYPIRDVRKHNRAYQILIDELKYLDRKIEDTRYHARQVDAGARHTVPLLRELSEKVHQAQANKLTANLRYRQLTEMLKVDLFRDLAAEEMENGHSVVVFVNFTETLKALAEKLKTDCIIWGEQSGSRAGMQDRQKNIERFQAGKSRVLVANINAGGVSISLHDLDGRFPRVSLISPVYSAIALTQALGRIHRAGAKSPAINRLIYAAGTVEEEVCRTVSNKLDAIASLNDGDLAERDIFNLIKKG